MYLIQKARTHNRLIARLAPIYNPAAIAWNDLGNFLSWQLSGRHYRKWYKEIIAEHFWCFIVGCNNSGTSLIQAVLSGSGQVSSHRYEGQIYTRVLGRARKRGYARIWSEYADELRMHAGEEAAPRLLHDWLRSLTRPLNRVIVEKTPANLLRMVWLQKVFPESCFIGIVRNGYAVSEGIRRKSGQEIGRAARHWNQTNKIMMDEAEHVANFQLLRYEDLCRNPARTMQGISRLTGINLNRLLQATEREFDLPTVTGSSTAGLKDYNSRSIVRLEPADLKIIRDNAHEMLDYFKYGV